MGLKILSSKDYNVKLKATIHSSGKLGFTESTARKLRLSTTSAVKFAQDTEDEDILYLINLSEGHSDSFPVNKAGNYFYVNAKGLFDALQIDYINNVVMFDMVDISESNMEIYKLNKREKKRMKGEK